MRGDNHPLRRRAKSQVGYKEWWQFKNDIISKYADRGRRFGEGPGIRRGRAGYLNGWAKRRVKRDMENIKKAIPGLDEIAEQALEGALEILHGANNQQTKLAAAKLLLEFTKSKPVAKSEVSVQNAEAWLAAIAEDDDDKQG